MFMKLFTTRYYKHWCIRTIFRRLIKEDVRSFNMYILCTLQKLQMYINNINHVESQTERAHKADAAAEDARYIAYLPKQKDHRNIPTASLYRSHCTRRGVTYIRVVHGALNTLTYIQCMNVTRAANCQHIYYTNIVYKEDCSYIYFYVCLTVL